MVNINERDDYQMTILHFLARDGHLDLIREVVARGAQIDVKCIRGNSPLYLAAIFDRVDCVKLLLEYGATNPKGSISVCNINIRTESGETALHGASYFGNIGTVELLLQHGIDTEVRNWKHELAFDLANGYSYFGIEPSPDDIQISNHIKRLIQDYDNIPTIKQPE
jgi:ankyrin repeat protein